MPVQAAAEAEAEAGAAAQRTSHCCVCSHCCVGGRWQLLNHRYMSRHIYGIETHTHTHTRSLGHITGHASSDSKFCCWLWRGLIFSFSNYQTERGQKIHTHRHTHTGTPRHTHRHTQAHTHAHTGHALWVSAGAQAGSIKWQFPVFRSCCGCCTANSPVSLAHLLPLPFCNPSPRPPRSDLRFLLPFMCGPVAVCCA